MGGFGLLLLMLICDCFYWYGDCGQKSKVLSRFTLVGNIPCYFQSSTFLFPLQFNNPLAPSFKEQSTTVELGRQQMVEQALQYLLRANDLHPCCSEFHDVLVNCFLYTTTYQQKCHILISHHSTISFSTEQ